MMYLSRQPPFCSVLAEYAFTKNIFPVPWAGLQKNVEQNAKEVETVFCGTEEGLA